MTDNNNNIKIALFDSLVWGSLRLAPITYSVNYHVCLLIGASLSEPHTSESNGGFSYNIIYLSYVVL